MNSALIHAAVFGFGAAVGVGITTTVIRKQRAVPITPINSVVIAEASSTKGAVVSPPTRATSSDVLLYGNPGPVSDFLQRKAYVAGYDRRLRHPAWTAEHLTAASLGRGQKPPEEGSRGDRGKSIFEEDESIPSPFRARLSDYFRSGYDRGHMVPAADAKASQQGMNETFLLTNIAPQVGAGFNRHYWAYLEDWCRRLTGTFSDVYVFTIPLYLPQQGIDGKWRITHEVIGSPPNISVPTHFAKVVLAAKPVSPSTPSVLELSLGGFVLPNAIISDEVPLESFGMPVDAIERAAGLTLFSDAIKSSAKNICKTTPCQLTIRKFDDAGKLLSSGSGGGGRTNSATSTPVK